MPYFNRIYHSICDGGDANRQLIKLHFSNLSPIEAHFAAKNMMTEDPMVFLMDCKVLIRFDYITIRFDSPSAHVGC